MLLFIVNLWGQSLYIRKSHRPGWFSTYLAHQGQATDLHLVQGCWWWQMTGARVEQVQNEWLMRSLVIDNWCMMNTSISVDWRLLENALTAGYLIYTWGKIIERVLTWFYLWYFDLRKKYMIDMGCIHLVSGAARSSGTPWVRYTWEEFLVFFLAGPWILILARTFEFLYC